LSEQPPAEDLEDLYETAPCGYLSASPEGRIVKISIPDTVTILRIGD